MDELWITEGPKEFERWLARGIVDAQDVSRIREGLEITAQGRIGEMDRDQTPEVYFPSLTARPWWDRESFSWIPGLEACADDIRRELAAFRSGHDDGSVPHPTGLAESGAWRALYLICIGRPQNKNIAAFPATMRALAPIPGGSSCGMTYFSTIEGGTHIAPHSGFTNAHLRCHLSLITPGQSRIRVADDTREWEDGKAVVFDDTFDHEVWNDGVGRRTVLLFDLWHPDLTPPEIEALTYMMDVWRRMYTRHFWAQQFDSRAELVTGPSA